VEVKSTMKTLSSKLHSVKPVEGATCIIGDVTYIFVKSGHWRPHFKLLFN
jgi:hypothetical protein